jgi:hypothetical protein
MHEALPASAFDAESIESIRTVDEVWLLGQPPLSDYLDFVRHWVIGGATADRAALTDEWRAANDYYHELEQAEAGIADRVGCRELDPELAAMAAEVMVDARYRQAFDTVPSSFGMVELDQLVIFQPHVTSQHVEALKAQLGPAPDPAALFRFCFPLGRSEPPVRIRQAGSRRYLFSSRSADFRFHEGLVLRPEQVHDYDTFGSVGGILGLVVGFGPNFLSAVRSDNRLILHNGYHRAYALRELGITHAPCVIETVTRRDELDVVAKDDVCQKPAFYLKAARPPLLKDFFDPKIRKVLRIERSVRVVEVSYEVREFELPE